MPRPREFDEDAALEAAMRLFWRHGYEGTSLADLTEAMGINRPSLYATFGNKEELFRRAVARYAAGPGAAVVAAMDLPTARATVEELLRVYAEAASQPARPLGCLLVNGAMSASPEADAIRGDLSRIRTASVEALRKRFERAQREGELEESVHPAHLARYYWSVLHGMAVAATDGATSAQLREVAALALTAFPGRRRGRASKRS